MSAWQLVLSYSWLISCIRWVSKAALLSCEFLTAAHDHTHYFKQNWSVAAGRFCNSCQDGFSILPCCDAGTIYLNGRKISTTSKLCLFRGITRYSERLCSSGTQSYSCMKELFWPKLQELGFDPNQYGLHGLRAGGASAAANASVPDHLFKRPWALAIRECKGCVHQG